MPFLSTLRLLAVLFLLVGAFYKATAQPIYTAGQLELNDGTKRIGQMAIKKIRKEKRIFVRTDGSTQADFGLDEIKSLRLGNEYLVSKNIGTSQIKYVLLRQLVAGYVSLYLYERSDGSNIFLIEKKQQLSSVPPNYAQVTLDSLLTECPPSASYRPVTLTNPATKKALSRYISAYNQCIKPGLSSINYQSASRSLRVSAGLRLFLPTGSFKVDNLSNPLDQPTTSWSVPAYGLSFVFNWRKRLGAGLDVAFIKREGYWNPDSTSNTVFVLDKLTERSLYINPYLKYVFKQQEKQLLTPYITLGFVYQKLLNGQVVQNARAYRDPLNPFYKGPATLSINQEAGLDEIGFSAGAGIDWQISERLSISADSRFAQSKAISSYRVLAPALGQVPLRPITYSLMSSIGFVLRL